ncbi:TonB-dependent receptor [Noviherbaspirillum saxi]|uniref:TonB-dependent receptor n=1 Tax=Noviherbaspirillum saxi TaxID=2320863 RepID=A0A3A3FN62_9BURK|nr:TonB-dependent receptor [Noviherbaspirillum saxi]
MPANAGRKNMLLASIKSLAVGTIFMASAPSYSSDDDNTQILPEVSVTGIRASLQQSLNAKRDADSIVETVTAEDIGKMPDRNVADAIQRVPGVNTSSSAGGEGGFDENDRVSIRGTSPNLTQTLINGHAVGTGDWFILNQVGNVGRSVSYSLLPSELVGRVTVHKTAQADLVEGGVAGTVNIETRKPLQFKKQLTTEATLEGVYSDLARKTGPQLSALMNWKNDADTMGVMVQAFSQTRHLRRDGQELLGYGVINSANTPDVVAARPDLNGVAYPQLIGSTLFQQERKREGSAFEVQIKPSNDLTLGLNGLYSRLSAKNYNNNFLAWPDNLLINGVAPDAYTINNGTLTSASFPAQGEYAAGVVDAIYRPGSRSETWYLNLDGKWRASSHLVVSGQIGTTRGVGETAKEVAFEGNINNTGLNYSMNGLSRATTVSFPGANVTDFAGTSFGWAWGSQIKSIDAERYGQLDGELAIDNSVIQTVKFGVRLANHERRVDWPVAAGPLSDTPASLPVWSGMRYPGNFGHGFGGALNNIWLLSPADIETWADANLNTDPVTRRNWTGEFKVKEDTTAGYAMANLAKDAWRGNVGLRLVRTRQSTTSNVAGGADPIVGSDFGAYTPQVIRHTYVDILPSANLSVDVSKDLVLRAAVARTMARPDYSALGGAVTLDNLQRTGTGGNPNLKPVRSTNVDAAIEWYFAPKSLLQFGLFYMDMSSYVSFGTAPAQYFNDQTRRVETYQITSPLNVAAKNKGFELGYQQPLARNFGVLANYTYADGKAADGSEMLGSSKNTWNLTGYYENERFNARLAYTYRSDFLVGLDRSFAQHAAGVGNLAASLSYKISANAMLTFDALNLNNATLKYYGENKDQPRALYSNGRQFYVGVRARM